MDPGVLLRCKTICQQPVPAQSQFFPGADTAKVSGTAAKRLNMHLKIRLMASCHDHYIVVRSDGQVPGEGGKAAAEGARCLGKAGFGCEFRPVVINEGTESHRGGHGTSA